MTEVAGETTWRAANDQELKSSHLFTSESVTEGHPDKIADQISDAILDAAISDDPRSRIACETLVTTGLVVVAGEITTSTYVDIPTLVREKVSQIGYTRAKFGFDSQTCGVITSIDPQSQDIAQGVDHASDAAQDAGLSDDELEEIGAGDQGMMFGYACSETKELMPLPITLSHALTRRLSEVRKQGILDYLRPDGKSQVTVRYEGDTPVAVEKVLISAQHKEGAQKSIREDLIDAVIEPVLGEMEELYDRGATEILVNPTGRFVVGGPQGDTGLTGRKIIVDTYGGAAPHGGGAFSGKDPTKVDRSGSYAARWVAKNVVAAGLAERCMVQLAYAIGVARPVSVMVETFGTARVDPSTLGTLIEEHFDLRAGAIIRDLDLGRPIYAATAAYGHFGRDEPGFRWEDTSRSDDLRRAAGG